LFKPAAARPKLVLANREHSGSLNIIKYWSNKPFLTMLLLISVYVN
jgi:hypothetical protein